MRVTRCERKFYLRPGVVYRYIRVRGMTTYHLSFECQTCKVPMERPKNAKWERNGFSPMLQDEVWLSIYSRGLACTQCVEEKLGRKLTLRDLTPCLFNMEWILECRSDLLQSPEVMNWWRALRSRRQRVTKRMTLFHQMLNRQGMETSA